MRARQRDSVRPDRIFDVEVAFDDEGIVRSMKMQALDNVGAYAGRSPFQLGKPIGAIVGPYRIASAQYRAQAVTSNKAAQEAVRGFGQAPTNYAIETAIDKVAAALGLDRICALLAGESSIREVIAFPKTTAAVDLMADAPSKVDPRQLRELRIRPFS